LQENKLERLLKKHIIDKQNSYQKLEELSEVKYKDIEDLDMLKLKVMEEKVELLE